MTRLVHYYSPLSHVLDRAFGALFNGDSAGLRRLHRARRRRNA